MGATLYHMLTGTFTRDFPRKMDPLLAIIQTENIPIRKRLPQISSSLGEVIDTAIAASPGSRYQTARDFRLALAKAC
jgi:serine/threonine protein kinase